MTKHALKKDLPENVSFNKNAISANDDRKEILQGLQKKQKVINPKYFYDTHGSELFERITQQPEYYPTRTERNILAHNASEIAQHCGDQCVLIEPGSGSSEKVRLLLDTVQPATYVPMDIAESFLQLSADKLGKEYPWLNIQAICADFHYFDDRSIELHHGRRVAFYPGSTLGNMSPDVALTFLKDIRRMVRVDGGLLIGIDLQKDNDRLHSAYNDKGGITEEFNLNVLRHVNRVVNGNFDVTNFSHDAFYNEEMNRIEMHLVSNSDHIVTLADTAISFSRGESIHTENSYKYSLSSSKQLVENAGFRLRSAWVDEDRLFSVQYFDAV
ncbi:dimethylhistidine N-methyltransferase [Gammaproteobacteria bacterium 45_16_T64]|nr:dimethylhistidine N-methyltransferase [Gammaproteobacteria bacterium 45_16_T64]